MARSVLLSPGAFADVREITHFIARRVSPASAARRHRGIETAIGRLEAEADRWPQADEATDLGFDLREMLHGRHRHVYRILFTIDGDVVNVLRVRHAAQDQLRLDDIP